MQDSTGSHRHIARRKFIQIGAAAASGIALAGPGAFRALAEEPPKPKLPVRRYGRTGLNVGAIIGASDWSKEVIPLGIAAGVNYWHKAQRWNKDTFPTALKQLPRESYYLEVVVDRVEGDHEKGRIDEESHYRFVKDCVEKSGVGYYDVFKFHFGYHSVEEAKTNPGMVRAFEQLKKEGLVKHLTISQHHYNKIGGDMAHDIVSHLIDNSPYEAAQFFYTYGDKNEVDEVMALARKKDFGTIAMKTMRGVGRAAEDGKFKELLADPRFAGSTPGAAMVKWLMSNPNLDAAVIAIKNFEQFEENIGAARQAAMRPNDRATLGLLAGYNKELTCLLCSECVTACPEHIGIADIMRYERYAMDYHDIERARAEYGALTKNGSSCIACGDCTPVCEPGINIIAKLKEIHGLLG